MVNGEDYSWKVIQHKGTPTGHGTRTWGRFEEEPLQLEGWHRWDYGGTGNKWVCWECRGYKRQLYSNKDELTYKPAAIKGEIFSHKRYIDPSYGIQVVRSGHPSYWEHFEYKWYCKSCLKKIGVLW